jgi:hypothetical protein
MGTREELLDLARRVDEEANCPHWNASQAVVLRKLAADLRNFAPPPPTDSEKGGA